MLVKKELAILIEVTKKELIKTRNNMKKTTIILVLLLGSRFYTNASDASTSTRMRLENAQQKLSLACKSGNLTVASSKLLKFPQLLDQGDSEYDWTPLGWAASSVANNPLDQNSVQVFLHLLNTGANPYRELEGGEVTQTPFSLIANSGRLDLLKAILNNSTPTVEQYERAIYEANHTQRAAAVKLLFEKSLESHKCSILGSLYSKMVEEESTFDDFGSAEYFLGAANCLLSLGALVDETVFGDDVSVYIKDNKTVSPISNMYNTLLKIQRRQNLIDDYCTDRLDKKDLKSLINKSKIITIDFNNLKNISGLCFNHLLNYLLKKIERNEGLIEKSKDLLEEFLVRLAREFISDTSRTDNDIKPFLETISPFYVNKAVKINSGLNKTLLNLFTEKVKSIRKKLRRANQNAGKKRTSDSDRSDAKRTH